MIIFPWLEQRKTEGLDRLTHQLSVKMASGHNLTCGAGHSGNIHCSPRMSLQPAQLLTLSQSIVSKGLSNKDCLTKTVSSLASTKEHNTQGCAIKSYMLQE